MSNITEITQTFPLKSEQDVADLLNGYEAKRTRPCSIVNIKKIYCDKRGFKPSNKLRKMMKVKQYFILDEAHFYF